MPGMNTMLNGLLLMATMACAAISGARVSRASQPRHPETALLIGVVVAYAQIVVVLQFSGFVLHTFSPFALAGLHLLVAAFVRAMTRGASSIAEASPRMPAPEAGSRTWMSAVWMLAALAIIGFVTVRFVIAVSMPVAGYDAIHYHLAGVADWLQTGTFSHPSYVLFAGRFPANADLLYLHLLAFFPSPRLIAPAGILFLLFLGVAVASLARALGVGREWSRWAAALAMMIPIAMAQSTSGYVDLATAAAVVALAALVAAYLQAGATATPWAVAAAGLSAGLLVGSKATGLAPAALAALAIVVSSRARFRWAHVALFVAALSLVGSSWYVRNWIVDGNPLAPYRLSVAGVTIVDGLDPSGHVTEPPLSLQVARPLQLFYAAASELSLFANPRGVTYDDHVLGLGPMWPLIGLPALLALVLLSRQFLAPPGRWAMGIVVLAGTAHPYLWWTRFTIPLAVAGVVAAAILASRNRWLRPAISIGGLVLSLIGGLAGAWSTAYLQGWWGSAPTALQKIAADGPFLTYEDLMPAMAWTGSLAPDAVIAVDEALSSTGYPLFPLFGPQLSRQLVGVSQASFVQTLQDPRVGAVIVEPDGELEARLRMPGSNFVEVPIQIVTGHAYLRTSRP